MRDDVSLARAVVPLRNGILCGIGAALIWGGYLAYSRLGVTQGLRPPDFAMLRFGVAGLIMLPYLARRGLFTLAGVGLWRGLVLTACAGPVFMLIVSGGYVYAPTQPGMWDRLGTRMVGFQVDRDGFDLEGEGRFRALRLCVAGNSVQFQSAEVHFRNGEQQQLPVRHFVRAGACTPPLDFDCCERRIRRVVMIYNTVPNFRGQAAVTLYGQR